MEREALKLAEIIEHFDNNDESLPLELLKEIAATLRALAQPAQEPVAWLQIGFPPFYDGEVIARTTKPEKWNPEWWKFEPLYTAPPQREWVGLTDEQQEEMYQMTDNISDCRTCYFKGIADAEAAHNRGAKP